MTDKKMKIVFAPGCFDTFEGTQEELDEMVAEIQRMLDSGELEENARPLSEDDLEEFPDEVLEQLINSFESDGKRNLQ